MAPKAHKKGGRKILRNTRSEYSCEGRREVTIVKGDGEKLGCSLENMRLVDVDPDTAAERCGARGFIGRKVTSVNGKPVRDVEEVREATRKGGEVLIGFEELSLWSNKGKRSVSEPVRVQKKAVSQRRRIDGSPSMLNKTPPQMFVEPEYVPSQMELPTHLPDTPFGTDKNIPKLKNTYAKYKFPPNQTSASMESIGLTPGGGKFVRSHSSPVSSVRRGRPNPQSTAADFLAHDNSLRRNPITTGIRQYNGRSSTPSSPSGRRRPNANPALLYHASFLVDPTPNQSPSVRQKGRCETDKNGGSHGDIIGSQWRGTRDAPVPRIISKRTGPIIVALPQPQYRFAGPTKKHPVPVPATSDIFNHQQYIPRSCADMTDAMGTGKGRSRTPQRNDNGAPSAGRRRSYTPTATSCPPWGTH
eukprot:TRINITY_DN4433_c2_g2_i1.p1 TRINITY_DN4433_c2_g2~~TRINITY_DN4433_c2_g2_i1.p1  ORF type:complete len:435 (+),score=73.46 TRINITY_DN4433_c2_g2_i1:59-1306(+)